ncbi:unnamed protein product [Adineta ricciae]|uniref:Uncharacterized protein n=1 Tax=Adineta ricciae TaxID=249248 RepID=A0A816HP90_ADIRI|nr:unnamed protein product [Adineta ricciae]
MFDIDGVYNTQNDRIWAANREEANQKGGVSLLVIFEQRNYVFGNDWTYQQDGAKPHTHHLTQQWCHDNFPAFIDKDHGIRQECPLENVLKF